jgi:hypothetical protein
MNVRQAVMDDALLATFLEGLLALACGAFLLLWLVGSCALSRFSFCHNSSI